MSAETWKQIEKRKLLKIKKETTKSERLCKIYREQYSKRDRSVKKSARADKKNFYENLAKDAQIAADKGEIKTLYEISRQISGKKRSPQHPVKGKDGKIITSDDGVKARWKEHFNEVLNVQHDDTTSSLNPLPDRAFNATQALDISAEEMEVMAGRGQGCSKSTEIKQSMWY